MKIGIIGAGLLGLAAVGEEMRETQWRATSLSQIKQAPEEWRRPGLEWFFFRPSDALQWKKARVNYEDNFHARDMRRLGIRGYELARAVLEKHGSVLLGVRGEFV